VLPSQGLSLIRLSRVCRVRGWFPPRHQRRKVTGELGQHSSAKHSSASTARPPGQGLTSHDVVGGRCADFSGA
jgi:hypothetical protein